MTQTLTETVASRVRELRGDMSAAQLADRVTSWTGLEMTRDAIANLENGRRTRISVEEVAALAYALGCSPLHLLVPAGDARARVHPIPKAMAMRESDEVGPGVTAADARAWIRGDSPLPEGIPAHRERSARFHDHDLLPEQWKAAEHPAVKALDRIRGAVMELLTHPGRDVGPLLDQWPQVERNLRIVSQHLDLLHDEYEQIQEALDAQRDERGDLPGGPAGRTMFTVEEG